MKCTVTCACLWTICLFCVREKTPWNWISFQAPEMQKKYTRARGKFCLCLCLGLSLGLCPYLPACVLLSSGNPKRHPHQVVSAIIRRHWKVPRHLLEHWPYKSRFTFFKWQGFQLRLFSWLNMYVFAVMSEIKGAYLYSCVSYGKD